MPDRCRTCKAPIKVAIERESGQPIRLDHDPRPDGTIRLAGARRKGGMPQATIIPEKRRDDPRNVGELYALHACPYEQRRRSR